MVGSFYVWVGNGEQPVMGNLALAMHTPVDPANPATSSLFGVNPEGARMAAKLSKRTGAAVYVSFNLATRTPMLIEAVGARLGKELAKLKD